MQCIQTECVASAEMVTPLRNDDAMRDETMLIVTTSEDKHELPDALMLNSSCENTNGDNIRPSCMAPSTEDVHIQLAFRLAGTVVGATLLVCGTPTRQAPLKSYQIHTTPLPMLHVLASNTQLIASDTFASDATSPCATNSHFDLVTERKFILQWKKASQNGILSLNDKVSVSSLFAS